MMRLRFSYLTAALSLVFRSVIIGSIALVVFTFMAFVAGAAVIPFTSESYVVSSIVGLGEVSMRGVNFLVTWLSNNPWSVFGLFTFSYVFHMFTWQMKWDEFLSRATYHGKRHPLWLELAFLTVLSIFVSVHFALLEAGIVPSYISEVPAKVMTVLYMGMVLLLSWSLHRTMVDDKVQYNHTIPGVFVWLTLVRLPLAYAALYLFIGSPQEAPFFISQTILLIPSAAAVGYLVTRYSRQRQKLDSMTKWN